MNRKGRSETNSEEKGTCMGSPGRAPMTVTVPSDEDMELIIGGMMSFADDPLSHALYSRMETDPEFRETAHYMMALDGATLLPPITKTRWERRAAKEEVEQLHWRAFHSLQNRDLIGAYRKVHDWGMGEEQAAYVYGVSVDELSDRLLCASHEVVYFMIDKSDLFPGTIEETALAVKKLRKRVEKLAERRMPLSLMKKCQELAETSDPAGKEVRLTALERWDMKTLLAFCLGETTSDEEAAMWRRIRSDAQFAFLAEHVFLAWSVPPG